MIVSPSLLSADFGNLARDIEMINKSKAQMLHLDVMDGVFVPNISFGFPVIKYVQQLCKKPLDVHLMIVEPQKLAAEFCRAGADLVTVHFEAASEENILAAIGIIRGCGKKVGISVRPGTPAEVLEKFIPLVDLVLVMTVEPGFGGQEFLHDCAMKIPQIKENAPENLIIQVDGGINNLTSKICTSLGATSLVAGSYIYGSSDYKRAIESLI